MNENAPSVVMLDQTLRSRGHMSDMDFDRALTEAFRAAADEYRGIAERISAGEPVNLEALVDAMRALQELAQRDLYEVPNEQWRRNIDDLARHAKSLSGPTHRLP